MMIPGLLAASLLFLNPLAGLAAGLDITADELRQDAQQRVIASGHVVIRQRPVRRISGLQIQRPDADTAVARMELATGKQPATPLVIRLRRFPDGWRIVSEHPGSTSQPSKGGSWGHAPAIIPWVKRWAAAWSSRDMDAYFGFYADDFELPAGFGSRQSWRKARKRAIEGKRWIRIDLSQMRAVRTDAIHAIAEFRQDYASDRFADSTLKRLELKLDDGAWKIVRERTIPAFSLQATSDETPEEALRDWRNAWNRRDLDAFLARYAEGAHPAGFATRTAWLEHLKRKFAAPPERTLKADRVIVDRDHHLIRAEGHVQMHSAEGEIRAESAEIDSESRNGVVENASLVLPDGQRLKARRLRRLGDGLFDAEDVQFTTCPENEEAWVLKARNAHLDQNAGELSARHARFAVAGVPLMYAPWWNQPLKRKSGLLTPKLGSGKRRGTEIGLPLYLAPSPSWDATLTPTTMSARGIQGELELRHVDILGHERLDVAGIRDRVTASDRSRIQADVDWSLPANMQLKLKADHVSDYLYLADYADGSEAASRYISSSASLSQNRFGEAFSVAWSLNAEHRQTLTSPSNAATLQTLPQLDSRMQWQTARWLRLHFDQQTTRFDRRLGTDGWRMDLHPWIELPWALNGGGLSATLAAGSHVTRYWLNGAAGTAMQRRSSREASLEIRGDLERIFAGRSWRHQISPVLRYDYIQVPDQTGMVNFDSRFGRLAWSNLLAGNRFTGLDRIERINRLSLMLENRLQTRDENAVRDVVLLRLGLAYDMLRQSVDPALQATPTRPFSDLLAELDLAPVSGLKLHASGQYNSADRYWPYLNASLDLSLGPARLHAGYRSTDPRYASEVRLVDASASIDLVRRWQIKGDWQYDLLLKLTQQSSFGLTYRHPCWTLGLEGYRLNRPNGTSQSADFGGRILLEFKGLGSVGSS